MSAIKEVSEAESLRLSSHVRNELHLYREGTFLRAYQSSAFLACRFLNDFKVNKRQFRDIETPVAYIGFPENSLQKWLPEGVVQSAVGEKHLMLSLPDAIMILYAYFGVQQTNFNEAAADLNGDNDITPADAIEALYRYFGVGCSARTNRPTAVMDSEDPE